MKHENYGYSKKVFYDFETAIEKITESLENNGFGIVSAINIAGKIKEKIGENMPKYIILGACNPKLAFEALQVETEIGLLLPCNVIVYEKNTAVFVSAMMPEVAMGFIDNPQLEIIAGKVENLLKKSVNEV